MKDIETNIDAVTVALTGIVEGNLDTVLAQFDDAPKWNVAEGLAEAGLHDGKDGIRKMLAARRERFRGGYKLTHLTIHGAQSNVFAEYTRGSEHCLAVFEMVVGKIREVREFVFST